ncbi:BON domain-containing class I SAM-dependent methyltransferase [Amycolatopsis cynarae]|uniref:BON domain-containing class I SAM-dependent methyltransferase n=1 Tax=Amycolatopsis cynarae TaxID=2995223 RepID=A0ABY7ATY7_9PSEU|nr:BON domain-containing class I SAM-dependent methyltransferase [Amycolatopsis sp. HUAS 11-8]WAL63424.1 BON domain-containing class I SAM-dependent methyltransferase [Amycolatopsis sp. HUAS 11-8]
MVPLSEQRLRMRDRFLDQAVRELWKYDDRVRGLGIDVRFDRGVAHLTGEVDDAGRLDTARSLIGRLDGVLAVWDRVRVAGRDPVVLDLGCGAQKQYPGNLGIDLHLTSEVDVRADVSAPLPFADGSADRVFLVHILEHLVDFLPLVDEVHRVLRPDGIAFVLSPWWRYVNAVADPTHVRLLDVQTIKGICRRAGSRRLWNPLHVGCDGAGVFAELRPLTDPADFPGEAELARFFD